MGWSELEGIANRGDFDLTQHMQHSGEKLEYVDPGTGERYVPHVIEPAAGADRATLAFMVDAYDEEEVEGRKRVVLRLHPRLAPVKVAVLPLVNKDGQPELAREIYEDLRERMPAEYDTGGSIGKRYRRQDEIGTPWGVTVDHQTLEDRTVTLRDRDSLVAGPDRDRRARRRARIAPRRPVALAQAGRIGSFRRPHRGVQTGRMQPLFEHGLTFGGYSTRVLELEGDGPPLVFFHGFSDSADTWRATMAKLGRLDRRAVAVDLPGFGKASQLKPGKVLPQLDRFGEAVVNYAAPDGGAVVVGNSLGGCLALRLAEREALELAGIVPVAPAGLDMARWLRIIERDPVVRFLLASPVPLPEFALRRAVAEVYSRIAFHSAGIGGREGDRRVHEPLRRPARRGAIPLHRPRAPARAEGPVPARADPRARCSSSGARRTAMVYSKGAQRVLDAVPGARLELLDECGHCPQVECPDRFAELLLDFPPLPLADAA